MPDAYNVKFHPSRRWVGPVPLNDLLIACDIRRAAGGSLSEARVMHNGVCHIIEYDGLHRTYTLTPLRDERIIIERHKA